MNVTKDPWFIFTPKSSLTSVQIHVCVCVFAGVFHRHSVNVSIRMFF